MKKICVIAHNRMKPELVEFLKQHEDWVWGRNLISTGLTADLLKTELNKVSIEAVSPGRSGGFLELREKVLAGEIDLVLFFRDPEIIQDYEADVISFIKSCIKTNIPLASNPASAELLIVGFIRMEAALRIRNKKESAELA